ncbi:shikimate 5-dehydrogenase [Paenibacillus vortex V453]|jgi:shikimate dehydrogenase|uniref:Shikimate dehydrogenase (NADP(+)) n=1 Tax=Paenibacillus vortex V453 TaxID=715225 RepID=A0A2R9SX84_9BACL|nr:MULTISPECIES: shikimate dehydrogenase [Paenibacillus]ANA81579.1 shikimate dehydrogenase [Paenibacillus glucanolyticus]AVV59690.1 shikimate dehydrogenase [Paenibacillus glucanolyticus]AWP28945.1 shikimate dehydrogenase [Paenibacillus sp. Cedars]EFU42004.1 shikimate 5-dehydrogenase [Paenibacillus vortex V453]ETT30387.1 shikimate 5-dehydrogenase [Paenibacillus sp. FSL R5-808]
MKENSWIERDYLLLGVMGDPIGHSKSPAMHNAAITALGLSGAYVPLHVRPEGLGEAIQAVKALGFRGVNVTIPHKVEVMKYLDVVDEGARQIGAVNTIVNDNGTLKGYNTDGIGYVRSLKDEACPDLKGKRIVVLGAGGAARGIIYALIGEKPETISIVNRTAAKALALAEEWSSLADLRGYGEDYAEEALLTADVIINTTSVGMFPRISEIPIPQGHIPEGIVVSDLIYNPLKTELLRQGELRQCTVHGGLGMFINQGAYALEYWTGLTAPVQAMKEAVLSSFQA